MATEISENFDGGVGEGADLRGVYTRNSEGKRPSLAPKRWE